MNFLSWATWVLRSAIDQTFAPAPTFSPDHVPDLTGKVVLVTGGNTGIGYEICLTSLTKGAKVYMAARDAKKATEAISQLKRVTGKTAITHLELDLNDLASVKRASKEFLSLEDRLDVLFCNAGVMVPPKSALTAQGFDAQFGVNVIGHHYLIQLLLPVLLEQKKEKSRIVMLSSIGHTLLSPSYRTSFLPDLTRPGQARDAIGKWGLYAHSKAGNILTAQWLDKEYGDKIIATSCHPGLIRTELYRTTPSFLTLLTQPVSQSAARGALTPLYLGFSPATEQSGGTYWVPWCRQVEGSLDPRLRGVGGEELHGFVVAVVEDWEEGRL